MKVAWLTESLKYLNGGVKYIYEMTRRLHRHADIAVFTTRSSRENIDMFGNAGVPVIEFSGVSSSDQRYYIFYPYYFQRNLSRLRRLTEGYDVIIAATTDIIAEKLSNKTLYICLEPNPWVYSKGFVAGKPLYQRIIGRLARPILKRIDDRIVSNAKNLVVLDDFNARRIANSYHKTPVTIYCGADTDLFHRQEISLDEYRDKNIIIHSASALNPLKGTKVLIEALPKVVAEIPNAKLLVLNSVPNEEEKHKLQEYATAIGMEQYIEFLPRLSESQLPLYYSQAKVVVQPSVYPGGAHLPIFEAAGCEVPGIVFDASASTETVVNDETGYIVPYLDMDALAQAIIRTIKEEKKRAAMGANARKRMLDKYSWDSSAEQLWDLIKEL